MFRKRILLASLLKPVSDTRLYEKIGKSLAKIPQAEVHLAGFASALPSSSDANGIYFHPIFSFSRLSVSRISAQLKFWKLLQKIRPAVLVVATHELLPVSWLYCKKHDCRLIYDVQENYFLNLSTQQVYPGLLGKAMGYLVRGIEKAVAPSVSHFFLAEQAYAQELSFLGSRFTILQNKYLPPLAVAPVTQHKAPVSLKGIKQLRLLYSGTISKLYGVLEAVKFTQQLRAWVPEAELTIIGYCADKEFLRELKHHIQPLPFVQLLGGGALVPHQEILAQEQQHHLGLLPYHPHPSTFTCIPTKLYEYIGNGLVVVAQENHLWANILERTQAGTCRSFLLELTSKEVEILLNRTYYQNGIPKAVFWQDEEQKVQRIIQDAAGFYSSK
jgi:glycosyltransferase involved in cell wall biosynthesis